MNNVIHAPVIVPLTPIMRNNVLPIMGPTMIPEARAMFEMLKTDP
jgi:hypothetical protein